MTRNVLKYAFCVAMMLQSVMITAQVWSPDVNANVYRNPIIYADYSDPDVCQVGDDYYMTSSSFNSIPGLQILHSTDLVHWTIVDAALPYSMPLVTGYKARFGDLVWAPSIRWHNGQFYIYYGDPDAGIFMVRGTIGHWEKPVHVKRYRGMIDPTPLWDEDGRVYLVHAYAGSRAGIKSVLAVCELDSTGTEVISPSRIIFDGHENHPTCEGPKFYKRNGYYYIFTPAGGVSTGWQLVLRSKNIYGPYEEKIVLAQGKSSVNGPHQGAWVETKEANKDGIRDWFIHFQDVGTYGRIVHLQPMRWVDDWPVIGEDKDGDGCGEPVMKCLKPALPPSEGAPQESDEFESTALGLQWQWAAEPKTTWYFCDAKNGLLRLYSEYNDSVPMLVDRQKKQGHDIRYPNMLLQKTPAEAFTVTTKVRFCPNKKDLGEQAGLVVSGRRSYLFRVPEEMKDQWVYLRVTFNRDALCSFYLSKDGKRWEKKDTFQAVEGQWIGAKVGLFCTRNKTINDAGWMDVDYFRLTK